MFIFYDLLYLIFPYIASNMLNGVQIISEISFSSFWEPYNCISYSAFKIPKYSF